MTTVGLGNKLEWTDESPSTPGVYVLVIREHYSICKINDRGDGVMETADGHRADDQDGWWIGPLPSPKHFVILPRVSEGPIATPARRLRVPQDRAIDFLRGIAGDDLASEFLCVPKDCLDEQRQRLDERDRRIAASNILASTTDFAQVSSRQCPGNAPRAIAQTHRRSRLLSVVMSLFGFVYFTERSR